MPGMRHYGSIACLLDRTARKKTFLRPLKLN